MNGRIVRDPDHWVRPDTDTFHLDGKKLKSARKVYLLFYKPKGIITSHGDPENRKTVYDCLDPDLRWVSPVGRLDKDSSGMLLLTNDTEFANFITDPANGIPKTYRVKLNARVSPEVLATAVSGIRMKRGDWSRPQIVRHIEDRRQHSWVEVVLAEGKNREVRRLFEALGFTVLKLVRTQIGALTLEGLEVGKWRRLLPSEIAGLKTAGRRTPAQIDCTDFL